ncbi:hypothetical protein [Azospirillum sp. sgz302134]
MNTATFPGDVLEAATTHLSVLDDFIAITQAKLEETSNSFARDSLNDLLASLREQRDTYVTFATPIVVAA